MREDVRRQPEPSQSEQSGWLQEPQRTIPRPRWRTRARGGETMTSLPRIPPRSAWVPIVFATRPAALTMDLALGAARVVLAWVFIYYGGGKLFGAFHGPGIHATSLYFANTAHLHPGGFFAVVAGLTEFGGAIALALGFLTRLAGLALFGDMVLAMITVTWATGFNSGNPPPGYQLNLALGVLALVVGMIGAGRFSADSVIARRLEKRQSPGEQTTVTDRRPPVTTTPPTMGEPYSSGAVVPEPRGSI
jgi:putative oxidoreductase